MEAAYIAYHGWKNAIRLTNGWVELVATLDVGPRILHFGFTGSQNLLKEFEGQAGHVGSAEWVGYGGHRLWCAPEMRPTTYYPDNDPIAHTWNGTLLTLTPPEQKSNHLQFGMEILLDPKHARARIHHHITNTGKDEIEMAPWSITMMHAGGRAILPHEPFASHEENLLPSRRLALWPYTRMNDPRVTWGEKYIQIREDNSVPGTFKIGAQNTLGWAAYLLHGDVFMKQFDYEADATYPDLGCNCEVYTEPGFLEVESLGPLRRLAPGASADHTETWDLFRKEIGEDENDIENNLENLRKDAS